MVTCKGFTLNSANTVVLSSVRILPFASGAVFVLTYDLVSGSTPVSVIVEIVSSSFFPGEEFETTAVFDIGFDS